MEMTESGKSLTKNTTEKTTKNTDIDYLSIYLNKVENLNIDTSIKNVLLKKIDRLIEDQIDLEEIFILWDAEKSHKDGLNEYQFADMLKTALSEAKEPIGSRGSVSNFFKATIKQYKQNLVIQPKEKAKSEPVRKELLPEWLNESDEKRTKINKTEELEKDPSYLQKKAELEERLKKYKNNK